MNFLPDGNQNNLDPEMLPEGRLRTLFEDGAVAFDLILEELQKIELSDGQLDLVKKGVVNKIVEILRHGNFSDLRGIKELLNTLKISTLDLNKEAIDFLLTWSNYLTFFDISRIGLAQTDPDKPNIECVRQIIQSKLPEGEIASDELIAQIINARHIFLLLKERRINNIQSNNLIRILTEGYEN